MKHFCYLCDKDWYCSRIDCSYYTDSVYDNCQMTTKDSNTIFLSSHDMEVFLNVIEHPPQPNEALKKVIKDFKFKYGDKK
jgi:uncharacterized protein (DUF1778 family)